MTTARIWRTLTVWHAVERLPVAPPKIIQSWKRDLVSGGGPPGAVGSTEINQETTMNKTLLSLAAATSITVSLLAAPPAEARCWGCAVGVGVAAGVVTGAIVGSAIANSRLTPCSPATRPTRAMRLRGRSNALGVTGRVARWHLTFMEIPSGGADPVSSVRKNSFAGGERRAGALKRSAPCLICALG